MSNLQISPKNSAITTYAKSTVLRELPTEVKASTQSSICDLLNRVAKLYQIPNWDELNAVLLSDWILETYPTETFETIQRALTKPRTVGKTWRLTPDVITEWMAFEIEQETIKREKEIHNAKQAEEQTGEGWTDERFKEVVKAIDSATGFTRGPALSPKEIREEGQEQPKQKGTIYPYTTREEHIARAMKLAWMTECHDARTGEKLPNWMTFEDWKKTI